MPLTPETISTLRAYRAHVQGTTKTPWTSILASDWLVAGPKHSGFDPNRWYVLQRLRNTEGPKILPYLDAVLDTQAPT